MNRKLIVLAAGAAFFVAAGASSCDENHVDAKGRTLDVNTRPADHVIAMPDEFPNVATKCAGFEHYRIWVVSHSKDDVAPVIMKDEACP
jgi:hypothetical protein